MIVGPQTWHVQPAPRGARMPRASAQAIGDPSEAGGLVEVVGATVLRILGVRAPTHEQAVAAGLSVLIALAGWFLIPRVRRWMS